MALPRLLPGALPFLLCALVACASGNESGHYWEITATAVADSCTNDASGTESFTYRVTYDDPSISVAVGPDVFASGEVNGCNISYESVAWTDERDGGDITWQIRGGAVAQFGDGACGMSDRDWNGTETFEVISSADPSIAAGCTYEMELTGSYIEEIP